MPVDESQVTFISLLVVVLRFCSSSAYFYFDYMRRQEEKKKKRVASFRFETRVPTVIDLSFC